MSSPACDSSIVGSLAVLQCAFPAMPMPEGVISLVEAGLSRVPGVAAARLHIEMEPLKSAPGVAPGPAERIWLQTMTARFGWLDLDIADVTAFAPYEPYVRNLVNDVAMHVESEHQQARLEQMVAALREADSRKDDFLGVLSHELRNPLAPIRNSIYLLERAAPGSEQASRAKEVIRRQTDHLTRLVDDLLDVKRFSTGKFRLHPIRMDVVEQVRATVEDSRPLLSNRSIALEMDAPSAPVWVNGDATRIAQIVSNLLQNAAKFTNAGGHVRVSIERGEGQVRIYVRDDGTGIAPELLPKVFEAFVQSENTLHRTRGGLGLGLALVRGIAELHGGTVHARSEGTGKGAEFVVALPTAAPPAAGDAPPTGSEASTSRHRVLVIEDNRDAAESLRDVLVNLGGHEVHVASDGKSGVDAARDFAPDVILCDLGLPMFDGYEVARRVRAASGDERGARLVALSGYAAPEDIERCLRAGFDYHVAKPPDVDRLLRLVADSPSSGAATTVPDDLATGHHEVDAQHAAILAEAARLRRAGPEAVWDSLRFLQHHTTAHFEYEEQLMEAVGYPGAAAHQEQHLAFVDEVLHLRDRLERDGITLDGISALADAVDRWIAKHVLDEDRRLAEFIRTREAAAA